MSEMFLLLLFLAPWVARTIVGVVALFRCHKMDVPAVLEALGLKKYRR
ncbi:hypothetical protein [Streptomyces globisporus]